jgi:hypothetical protein
VSDAPVTSSSVTIASIKIVHKLTPDMPNYWKKSIVSEADHQAHHDFGWLMDNLVSMVPEVDIPTTHDSTVVHFDSHLIAGIGLPPVTPTFYKNKILST